MKKFYKNRNHCANDLKGGDQRELYISSSSEITDKGAG
jgi:hypothetical protein